ncbi:MAG TPA: hypothetical protein DCM28_16600 [Phycisphaerales bacterium]|nr:hypothetical protein [Phycisphaerales bacterium]HCD34055.1 hypothetical protein [Phycisphaerales bacterium]
MGLFFIACSLVVGSHRWELFDISRNKGATKFGENVSEDQLADMDALFCHDYVAQANCRFCFMVVGILFPMDEMGMIKMSSTTTKPARSFPVTIPVYGTFR